MEFLTEFTVQELEKRLVELGVEKWRARPILLWVHRRNATSFDEMTDLSLELRVELAKHFGVYRTKIQTSHASPDGTTKHLIALEDGDVIETVLIPEEDRRTVCVSTQVGCPIKCVFCASGLNGLKRNLTSGEIVEQVLYAKRDLALETAQLRSAEPAQGAPDGSPAPSQGRADENRLSNVVIMGIGEPLLNATALIKALKTMKASWGMGIGYNRITLSTVGVLGQLPELVKQNVTPNLALSLHAPNDAIRAEVVPTMKNVKLIDIIKAGYEYKQATGKNVTFEYVLLEGVNDDKKHALELGKKIAGTKMKVNVIPFNRVEEVSYRAPTQEKIDRFVTALGNCGVPVMVRKRKGDEVSAACGQLRAKWTAKSSECPTS